MNKFYDELKDKAFSAFRTLAKNCSQFEDANMLVGSADTKVSLTRSKVSKSIDTEWIERIEAAIPSLDIIIRNPSVAIEDVDEVLPVELSKHITEKSIKHLAQHTNFILDIKEDGEVVPQKILNVFHEETHLTYENKFVNTLLNRLFAFVDKRIRALDGTSGIEMDYKFGYNTEFEHFISDDGSRNSARINLQIELTSPVNEEMSESDLEINERYKETLERIKRINMALISYRSSAFAQKLGRNYVRPPVIRTNAILKNKNLKECLNLWEYIEEYDKVGYTVVGDKYYEMPSEKFVGGMYSPIALQYLTLYSSIHEGLEDNRLISQKHLFETFPEFDDEIENEEIYDYQVYDSEYKKLVPVSRLMNNRKKLSEDEKRVRAALIVALKADELLNAEELGKEAEARRLARERRLAEEEARRLAEEEAEKNKIKSVVAVRYSRSFMSRYIQAESFLQDWYCEIKNELLSYKNVKSRISWSRETFKLGRTQLARINVRGRKTLYLYLAINPELLEGTKYQFETVEGEYPVLIKITSNRRKSHALAVIGILAGNLGLARTERIAEDYRLPYEDDDKLIEKGLIKMILPKGVKLDESIATVKADIYINSKKEKATLQAPPPVEEVEETPVLKPRICAVAVKYSRSFTARYIQSDAMLQDWYVEIKNELLSYKKVKSRISWSKETFKLGRTHIAKINARGKKKLYLYLAISPALLEGTKYQFETVEGEYPVLIKITSNRRKAHALSIIEIIAGNLGLTRTERIAEDYRLPYEDDDKLIEKGLIKMILPKGVTLDESVATVKADIYINSKKKKATLKAPPPVEEVEEIPVLKPGICAVAVKYRRSFTARYIQADPVLQDWYTEIKNGFLSYSDVKSRISWSKETFKIGRTHIAKINVKGKKTLDLYFAIDPALLSDTKFRFEAVEGDYPVRIKVTSDRRKALALRLIKFVAQSLKLKATERIPQNYRQPFEDDERLIANGLIKMILPKGITLGENVVTVRADIDINSKKKKSGKKN